MEFDENLVKLQGALSSFSTSTSDHEKLEVLSMIFQNVDETDKIKMVFFLILNTRMTVTEQLKGDNNVGLLSNICQNLDFPALSYVILNLNLVSYLSDIVRNGPAAFTVELLDGVFAYADSRTKIRGLDKVITALFEKILKISRGIHRDFCFSCKLWEFMNSFGDMLWCRTTFENEDLMEEDMNKLLETCLVCVNLYEGKTPLSVNPIFEINVLYDEFKKEDCDGIQEPDCKTKFEKYIFKLLDLFNDIFNYSFSFAYDQTESEIRLMSENAYILYEILENSEIKPSNISYLDNVKRKPETELEKISKCDIKTIVSTISRGTASKNWLKALINFPEVTENEEAIICLKNHLDIADYQDLKSVVALIQAQFKKNSVSEILLNLLFCCLSKMTLVDQLFYVENHFALEHRPSLENSTFDEELTEMFNKVLESDSRDVSTKSCLVTFCIRSPVKTIKKICERALSNSTQLNNSIEDLKMLKAACLSKNFSSQQQPELDIISSVLFNIIDGEDYAPKEKPHLISLITQLQKEKLLDANIEICIMNIVHKELSVENYEKIEFALEILRSSVKLRLLRSNEVVLLAFFSQVLNHTSWSCSTFSAKLVKIREIVISVINLVMRSSKFSANDAELAWLRSEIMKSWEINRLYFCDLWYSYDCDFTTSSDLYVHLFILLHTKTKGDSIIDLIANMFKSQKLLDLRISFTAAFIQILPILTSREWTLLLANVKSIIAAWLDLQDLEEKSDIDASLVIFRIFTMAMYSLAQDMNQNQDMMPCFSYCLRNFGKTIQQNFLACTDLKYEVGVVFLEELLFLLNGVQDLQFRRENSVILSPVILEIGSRCKNDAPEKDNKLQKLENWYKNDFIGQTSNKLLSDL